MVANAQDFFKGSDAFKCFVDAVFEQGAHAEEPGLAANGLRGLAIERHFADGGVQLEELEDAKPAAVAGVMAIIATPAAAEVGGGDPVLADASGLQFGHGRLVRLLAFWANYTDKALGHDCDNRRCDKKRLYTNIDQTCNSAGRIVR